jgi:hypothetical protein
MRSGKIGGERFRTVGHNPMEPHPSIAASRIITPSRSDASSPADGASRSPPARGLRNVPNSESDESFPEVVEVRDPHHPLYGRSFRVIRKIGQRGRGIPASYEVEFRTGCSLLIQATAIEYYGQEANQIKLSMEALLELLSTADCPDAHEHGSSRSLVDADARAPTPDRRRRRRDFGGDPS